METKDIILVAVTLLILGEVTYLLTRLPRTSIKSKGQAILVDTSVLMDGRITAIAETGFIGGTLVVPRSVVGELQFLADNADSDKRARARRGLDIISELQTMAGVDVEILQDGSKADEGVDERLLSLAKQHSASICTIDYNLNKVAVVEGIKVLNINELAQGLRMAYLPGEHMALELVQKGQDSHQAVGYLPDGTMVVVEQGSSLLGQTVDVEIVRSLQTAAGKMMFAKRVENKTTQTGGRGNDRNSSHNRKQSPHRSERPQHTAERQPEPVAKKQPYQQARATNHSHQNSQTDKSQRRQSSHRRVDRESVIIGLVDKQQ